AFTWGGGYVMLPLIRNEVVEKKKWISSEDFINGIAVAQSVPGAIAINIANFTGNKVCGDLGSIVAVLGAMLPSLITIIVVAAFFSQFRELTVVQNFFKGASPAIVALMVSAVISLGKYALKKWSDVFITLGLLFLLLYFEMHPIIAIIIAAVSGLFLGRKR
ncbi:MAG: chromate transporter, partial [Dehalococcoidales bacterium]|nr:chromate transporter [Dehalococcoidales bacterium]